MDVKPEKFSSLRHMMKNYFTSKNRVGCPNSAGKIYFFSAALITRVLHVGWSYTFFSGIEQTFLYRLT
jgi:hypothetical protein